MADSFNGFDPAALTFFRKLAKNNDRDWFKAHKSEYDQHLKEPMLRLLQVLNERIAKFAPDHVTDPKKAIYRIYRDTRFSKKKIPLKLNISAMFPHHLLPKNQCAGFYCHVSATEIAIGVGLYASEPHQLLAVRQAIATDPSGFIKLVTDKKTVIKMGPMAGESLQRLPKGFDPNHPAADYLKRKQFYFYRQIDPKIALSKSIITQVSQSFEQCAAFAAWINRVLINIHAATESDLPQRPAPMF